MTQTAKGSFVEAWANIAVGFGINFLFNAICLPWFIGHPVSWKANLGYGTLMTGVSLARSFVLRRWFNGLKFGNKERPLVSVPPMPAPLPEVPAEPRPIAMHPHPDPDGPLSDFLDRVLTSLQEKGVGYVDATVYSPRFNELANLRVQLLGRRPRVH